MTPFLKWAGGKRWLIKQLATELPAKFDNYVEPFLGSGAVFFDLLPAKSILSDANEALIETYRAVRDHPKEVHDRLGVLHHTHSEELYYQQRSSAPKNEIDRAVRFIYLNRTCWNGLYRVNRNNEFNVPKGTKDSVILVDDDFPAISKSLRSAIIISNDFEVSIDQAMAGDLIFVDPPYTVKHNMNGFRKYNQVMFSWEDQIRLRDSLVRARARGCSILMSNADHQSIRDLYSDFDRKISIQRASVIAGQSKARGKTTELLVVHHG